LYTHDFAELHRVCCVMRDEWAESKE